MSDQRSLPKHRKRNHANAAASTSRNFAEFARPAGGKLVPTAGQKHAGSKPVICVETASPGTKTRPQHSRLEQKNKFASPKKRRIAEKTEQEVVEVIDADLRIACGGCG